MRSPRCTVVEIGASHVACGVVSQGERLALECFDVEPLRPDSSYDRDWPVRVGDALRALATRANTGGPCTLVVPGHLVLNRLVRIPSVPGEERQPAIVAAAAEHIPLPLAEIVWDHRVVSDDGRELELLLVAARREAMEALCAALHAAGFSVESVLPAGVALFEAIRLSFPDRSAPTLLVSVGARSTTAVLAAGERFFLRTFGVGGNAISEALAKQLRIEFGPAEALKVQVFAGTCDLPANSLSHTAGHQATAAFCERLQLELRRTLMNWQRQPGAAPATALYLTGRGALVPDVPPALAHSLGLPVERFDSYQRIEINPGARTAFRQAQGPPLKNGFGREPVEPAGPHQSTSGPAARAPRELARVELIGAAIHRLQRTDWKIDLLPPAAARALAARKGQPRYLAASFLLAAALLPAAFFWRERATATLAEAMAIERRLEPLRALQAANERQRRELAETRKQMEVLRVPYEARTSWRDFLAQLQADMVTIENIWLDRLQLEELPAGSEAPPRRLRLSGRLLDVANPRAKVSPQSFERVNAFLARLRNSRFVAAIEAERFDSSDEGLLRFDVTLVLNPRRPL